MFPLVATGQVRLKPLGTGSLCSRLLSECRACKGAVWLEGNVDVPACNGDIASAYNVGGDIAARSFRSTIR